MDIRIEHFPLKFIRPAGTSRGVMNVKNSWFITISHLGFEGKGEISIIEGLSKEWTSKAEFEGIIFRFVHHLNKIISTNGSLPTWDNLLHLIPELVDYPSILFGLETALLDWENGGKSIIFSNAFSRGEQKIPINGLIWMGDEHEMLSQIDEKLQAGFTTLKMKVGAIDFEKEYTILKSIRSRYSSSDITLRVDANGAFKLSTVYDRLNKLAELDIHSIEQPISPGQFELMSDLCAENLVPIALDEELIGVHSTAEKIQLLEEIRPPFIILKPSLHGGIQGTKEWIELAEDRKIDWWMTSALESNIGLNAICQFVGEYSIELPQGLGTGSLYENNVPSALNVRDGHIFISY
jgi:L-alanine-DL-glutamate epimerase-like enolase superfamily enzyme